MVSIGIDLGTTYSCVGTWKNNKVEIIPNDMGERTTPSCVAFTYTEILVGTKAKQQAARNAENTIFNVKRLIGRRFDEEVVQSIIKKSPVRIVCDDDIYEIVDKSPLIKQLNVSSIIIKQIAEYVGSQRKPMYEVEYKSEKQRFYPEEIGAMILTYMKQIAETYLGGTVTNAVVSVPAYFNDAQRQATVDAAKIAGLNLLRLINAPTATAIAYGLDMKQCREQAQGNVMFMDLGGGTLDVSLMNIDDGVYEVLATAGNNCLGGEDIDDLLVDFFAKEFKRKNKVDMTKSKRSMRRLRTQCERAKRTLSAAARANIEIDSLYDGIDFASSIGRGRFEDLCMHYFRQCLEPVSKVLQDAKMSKSDVDEYVLYSDSTRIARIRAMIKNYFKGKEMHRFSWRWTGHVAAGAAIQAAILSGEEMGDKGDLLVLDVAPLSLGLEKAGGVMTKLVEGNKTIPCKANEIFTTYADNQGNLSIEIFEGNRQMAEDNNHLCTFEVKGIPPAPRGVPQIEVTFDLDANGILSVSARNKVSSFGNVRIATNTHKLGLSEHQIDKMIEKTKIYKAEQRERQKTIRAKNELENMAYQMRNTLDDAKFKDMFNDDDKKKVQNIVKETIDWVDANPNAEREKYECKRKEIEAVWRPIMSISQPPPNRGGASGIKIDEVD